MALSSEPQKAPNGKTYEVIAGIPPQLATHPVRESLLVRIRACLTNEGFAINGPMGTTSYAIEARPDLPYGVSPEQTHLICTLYMNAVKDRIELLLQQIPVTDEELEIFHKASHHKPEFPAFVGTRIVG